MREDYLDRLHRAGLEPWPMDSGKAVAARDYAKAHPDWKDWRDIFETRPEETLCNLMITLCHQTQSLLDGMVKRQEEQHKAFGGIRERMHAVRTEARAEEWNKAIYSKLDLAKDAAALAHAAQELHLAIDSASRSIARKKGWQ